MSLAEVTGRLDGRPASWDGSLAWVSDAWKAGVSPLAIGIQTYSSMSIENGPVKRDKAECMYFLPEYIVKNGTMLECAGGLNGKQ